jgi:hypothetical protein
VIERYSRGTAWQRSAPANVRFGPIADIRDCRRCPERTISAWAPVNKPTYSHGQDLGGKEDLSDQGFAAFL